MSGLVLGGGVYGNSTYAMCLPNQGAVVTPVYESHEAKRREMERSFRNCSKLIVNLGVVQAQSPWGCACIDFSNCAELTDNERRIVAINAERCRSYDPVTKVFTAFVVAVWALSNIFSVD